MRFRPALQTTASISGLVSDVSGTRLSGARVEASSPSLQGTRSTTTDQDGRFWLPALPPGGYRVAVRISGFRPEDRSVRVALDSTVTLAIALLPAVEESVAVSGENPVIETASTTTGGSYTAEVISQLPVDRNYADIVRMDPGVSTDHGDTQGRSLP